MEVAKSSSVPCNQVVLYSSFSSSSSSSSSYLASSWPCSSFCYHHSSSSSSCASSFQCRPLLIYKSGRQAATREKRSWPPESCPKASFKNLSRIFQESFKNPGAQRDRDGERKNSSGPEMHPECQERQEIDANIQHSISKIQLRSFHPPPPSPSSSPASATSAVKTIKES